MSQSDITALELIVSDGAAHHFTSNMLSNTNTKTIDLLFDIHKSLCRLLLIQQKLSGYYILIFPNASSKNLDFSFFNQQILSPIIKLSVNSNKILTELLSPNSQYKTKANNSHANNKETPTDLEKVQASLNLISRHLTSASQSLIFLNFNFKKLIIRDLSYHIPLLKPKVLDNEEYTTVEYLLNDIKKLRLFLADNNFLENPTVQKNLAKTSEAFQNHIDLLQHDFLKLKPIKGYLIEKFNFITTHQDKTSQSYFEFLKAASVKGDVNFLIDNFKKINHNHPVRKASPLTNKRVSATAPATAFNCCCCASSNNLKNYIENVANLDINEFSYFYKVKSPIDYDYSMSNSLESDYLMDTINNDQQAKSNTFLKLLVTIVVNTTKVLKSLSIFCEICASLPNLQKEGKFYGQKFAKISTRFNRFVTFLDGFTLKENDASDDAKEQKLESFTASFRQLITNLLKLNYVMTSFNSSILYKLFVENNDDSTLEELLNYCLLQTMELCNESENQCNAQQSLLLPEFSQENQDLVYVKFENFFKSNYSIHFVDFIISCLRFDKKLNHLVYGIVLKNNSKLNIVGYLAKFELFKYGTSDSNNNNSHELSKKIEKELTFQVLDAIRSPNNTHPNNESIGLNYKLSDDNYDEDSESEDGIESYSENEKRKNFATNSVPLSLDSKTPSHSEINLKAPEPLELCNFNFNNLQNANNAITALLSDDRNNNNNNKNNKIESTNCKKRIISNQCNYLIQLRSDIKAIEITAGEMFSVENLLMYNDQIENPSKRIKLAKDLN